MDNIFSRISCCGTSSSSPTVDVSHFKAEIDGNFSEDTLDELISQMDLLLKKLKGEQASTSVAASSAGVNAARSTADKILEELAKRIQHNMGRVKRNARKAKRKVMAALDNSTTKLIGEILKESQAFPYVGIAAAVVVCVLDKIDQMRKVDDERLKFLERMWSMVKIINNVRNPNHRDQCGEMFRFVLKMSICIVNKIQQTPGLVSFLSSNIDAADLEDMERKFADQHQNLMADLLVSIRNDIPQVKPPPPILDMPDTYGIEEAIEEVKTRLDMEGKSQKIIVTIFGLGGIGKTTLAEAVTNSLSNSLSDYKFCRLYLNSDLKSSKIEDLQAQLLRDVFSKNPIVSNPSEGRTFILDAVKKNQEKKPLYLFIDNALEGSEIERLLPLESISKLSLEVRILVTTRDCGKILPQPRFENKKYRVGENPAAKEMLCHYAGENPNSEFANMKEVDDVLRICGGIPLFIKLAGKKLLNQVDKANICKDMTAAALRVDNNTILDFVYEQLPHDFQQAFLDIAFFYLGCQRYKLELIYTQDVIKGLEDAALITQDRGRKERVRMHDRLRERAHDLSKGERVSDRSEWEEAIESEKLDTIKALKLQNVQPEDIKSVNKCGNLTSLFLDLSTEKYNRNRRIPMHMDLSLPACIKVLCITGHAAITIRQWKHLQVLKLKHVNVKGSLKNFGRGGRLEKMIFMELVDFTEENDTVFSMSNYPCLKRLRLGGSMLESFPNEFQDVSSLESLKLDRCPQLIRLDSGITGCSKLSLLSLKGCKMLRNLPREIEELQRLEKLDLSGCTNLQNLPQEIGELRRLEKLDLQGCTNLQTLPETVGRLQHLKILDLSWCTGLKNLPESFGHLSSLEKLDMHECENLESLCDSFGQLSSLQKLNLYNCENLQRLPESLEGLQCLTKLRLQKCTGLEILPESFGLLSSLEKLNMQGCKNLKSLCDSFGQLSRLQKLDLYYCKSLQTLPESLEGLQCLTELMLIECSGLEILPQSFGLLSSLEKLKMSHCTNLKNLCDSFGNLSRLQELDLEDCEKLQKLPEHLEGLKSLKRLLLRGCEELESLPESFGHLSSVEKLDMSRCVNLENLCDSFGDLSSLQDLVLEDCEKLQKLPKSLKGLKSLKRLLLRGCEKLESLPESFGHLSSLEKLDMFRCVNLKNLCDSFGNLSRLQELDLAVCEKLKKLPESLEGLKSLKRLVLRGCEELESLPESFGRLSSLEELDMKWCAKLENLCVSFGNLSRLQDLVLEECEKLQKLPESLEGLKCLKRLWLWGCKELKSLPESFGGLQCLKLLVLDGCQGLKCLPPSFSQLSSLEVLDMVKCSSLKYLGDDFGKLTRLEKLNLTDCEKLQRLPESFGGLSSLRKLWLAGCSGLEKLPENLGKFLPSLLLVDVRGCHQLIRNDGLTELLSIQSLLIILHSTSTHSNVLRFVIGNDIHLDHAMEENQHLDEVMKKCHSEVETLLKGGGYMRLEEGGKMVWEDAVSSGVARTGAKVVYLNTGWCRHLSDDCKSWLQEAVDEGYEVVLVDNGVHRWNRHVAVEGKKLNGEVPWNEEDTEMMKEMMCQVPGGCTRVWTSPFPKNCLLFTMLLYGLSGSRIQEVTMTKGKWEGDDNQSNTFNFEESKAWFNYYDSGRNKDGIEILGSQFRDNEYPLSEFFMYITNTY